MENKLNIAEILKDCPKGMELYSPIFGEVYLDKIRPHLAIVVTTDKEQGDFKEEFLYDGRYGMNGECMLFPSKDKTTWEGFQRPAKDGDVVVCEEQKMITQMFVVQSEHKEGRGKCYFGYDFENEDFFKENIWEWDRLATEKERQKLFDEIRAKGCRWNAETKTLEKLPGKKFKDGDIIFSNRGDIHLMRDEDSSYCAYRKAHGINTLDSTVTNSVRAIRLATKNEKEKLFKAIEDNGYKWNAETKTLDKLIEPNFKIGDKIKHKYNNTYCTLGEYSEGISAYRTNIGLVLTYKDLEHWELVPDKFDINTLEIFKSKVLVRDNKDENWKPAIFGGFKKERNVPYVVVGGIWFKYLIPYEGNEHLSLSKNDCDDFYKTWE